MTSCRDEQRAHFLSRESTDMGPDIEPDLEPDPDLVVGPVDMACSDGAIALHIDIDDENSYVDAPSEHRRRCRGDCLDEILQAIDARGLELLPEHECEPERLSNGSTRIYLAEKAPGMAAA